MKKITMTVKDQNSQWTEDYEIANDESPEEYCKSLIKGFNRSLRPNESSREFVSVNVVKYNLNFEMFSGHEIIGWDGYIDKDGVFYATKPSEIRGYFNGSFQCHEDFAYEFIDLNFKDASKTREKFNSYRKNEEVITDKDHLVHICGFVSITVSEIFGEKEAHICRPQTITEEQKKTMLGWSRANKIQIEKEYFILTEEY